MQREENKESRLGMIRLVACFRLISNVFDFPFKELFRVRVAIIDHIVRGALSSSQTSSAAGSAAEDHARARDSNAATGIIQDMYANSAILFIQKLGCCSEIEDLARKAKPPRFS